MSLTDNEAMKQLREEEKRKAQAEVLHRQRNYQAIFVHDEQGNPAPTTMEVLEDLASFCRAHESCFDPNPQVQAMLEGRREVWLRIERNIKLSSQKLWSLYENRKF